MTTRYYHDGQNPVAEYLYDTSTCTLTRTYVHGAQYIDERAVMRDYEDGGQDHYYLLKDLYTVAGLAGSNGALEEAYVYDTYGNAAIYEWSYGDIDRDGDADSTDIQWVVSHLSPFLHSGVDARCDIDFSGIVNGTDILLVRDAPDGGVPITRSALGNPYFFTGRITDTWHASDSQVANDPDFRRMQDNRNRMYDPKHGRWLQRDPHGLIEPYSVLVPSGELEHRQQYLDGMNLMEYVRSRPTNVSDPYGLIITQSQLRDCYHVCGQCFNACYEATGCDDGECKPKYRTLCSQARTNCRRMCQIAGRPTKRCGGGAFKTACAQSYTPPVVGAIVGDALGAGLIRKNCVKAGCCTIVVSQAAALAEIATVWKTAGDLAALLDTMKDYHDCMGSADTCGNDACQDFLH